MTDAERTAAVQQQIEASGQAQVTQVAGNYEPRSPACRGATKV
jgi:hypothetical protein